MPHKILFYKHIFYNHISLDFIVICTVLFIGFPAFAQPRKSIYIKVNIKPMPHVESIYSEIEKDKYRNGILYILSKDNGKETLIDLCKNNNQYLNLFEYRLKNKYLNETIILRPIYPDGLVAHDDILFIPNNVMPEGPAPVISEIMLLTKKSDRFTNEIKKIEQNMDKGECFEVKRRINFVEEYFLPDGPNSYYTLSKYRADILYQYNSEAVLDNDKHNCPYDQTDLEIIFKIEAHILFKELSDNQKYNIYLQFGRSLQSINHSTRLLSSGMTVLDVIEYCFSKAFKYQTVNGLKSKQGWFFVNEYANELFKYNKYRKAMDFILEFFKKSEFDAINLNYDQEICIISLLTIFHKIISDYTNRLCYTEEDYIQTMRLNMAYKKYWKNYNELLNKWRSLYFGIAKKNEAELYIDLYLSNKII